MLVGLAEVDYTLKPPEISMFWLTSLQMVRLEQTHQRLKLAVEAVARAVASNCEQVARCMLARVLRCRPRAAPAATLRPAQRVVPAVAVVAGLCASRALASTTRVP